MTKFNVFNKIGVAFDSPALDSAVHLPSTDPVKLPEQVAPDLNGFLNDHGIDFGSNGSPIGNTNLGGSDDNSGPMPGLPGSTGGSDSPGVPGGVDLGHGGLSGLGVPDGLDFDDFPSGPGVPDGLSFGDDISGLGVPNDITGGIFGPGVPNNSGSIGVGGFTAGDFQKPGLADSPEDGGAKGGGSWWTSAWSNLSHGHVAAAGWDAATGIVADGAARSNGGDHFAGGMEQAAGGLVGAVVVGAVVAAVGAGGPIGTAVVVGTTAVVGDPDTKPKDDTTPDPAPEPDPNKGSQPVDDSGTGPAHPSTHTNEQPVDDSGGGPVHPMTSTTAQPVDDSGVGPVHPGMQVGVGAIGAQSMASANFIAVPVDDGETGGHGRDVGGHSFGGHSGAFWDAAVQSVADSELHASAAANASVAVAGAPVAQNGSLGIFESSALTSFAASGPAADSHANMDALATTHIASVHVEAETSHSFEVSLDLSHVALHM